MSCGCAAPLVKIKLENMCEGHATKYNIHEQDITKENDGAVGTTCLTTVPPTVLGRDVHEVLHEKQYREVLLLWYCTTLVL